MKKKIQLLPSGITLIDNNWGGLYRGGTYLLIGSRKSGRTLLGLQFAMECAAQKEVCLYFTSMRPKDLMIQAASIDFDLQHYMNQNLIIVVRVAPPSDFYEVGNPDEFLVEYMNDIVTVVDQYQPNKIVFDELTPFIGFNNVNLLKNVFMHTTETIEDNGITSLFILGEPATPLAESIIDALAAYSTGIVYLKKKESEAGSSSGGVMTITPNIGHTEGQFKANYCIEPYKGITIELKKIQTQTNPSSFTVTNPSDTDRKYKSLTDIDLPEENIFIPNYYSINDFYLILNNQIALYKSTAQVFTIISFRLDQAAEKLGLLTITQLQNAIRLSTDKKDKLCIFNNKVIILVTKDDQKSVISLIGKVKSNLPSNDPIYIKNIIQYISVYAVKVDQSVQTADDIFQQLTSDEHKEKNELGFY
ncbi:MAG: RAD55 family ATPase [Ignavibacteriaceae bacterium]|jgi:circadian clock protein KaiC